MKSPIQSFVLTFCGLLLNGCMHRLQPTVQEYDLHIDNSDGLLIGELILTKRVKLEHGREKRQLYLSNKAVDVTATSRFGKEGEIANVDCIVAGIREVLKEPTIISPSEFWKSAGDNKDTLNLASLLDESYSYLNNLLDLDYIIISYHQLIDYEAVFMEYLAEGGYVNKDREIAAAITIDMNSKHVINAIEVDANHSTGVAHIVFVIPLVWDQHPADDPCIMTGRHAAEAISNTVSTNKVPRIAVVASETNPLNSLTKSISKDIIRKAQEGDPESNYQVYQSLVTVYRNEAMYSLCQAADKGYFPALIEVGDLYWREHSGTKQDLQRAYVWYALAAKKGGNNWDVWELRHVKKEMTSHQLKDAVQMLADWEPGQCARDLVPDTPNN